MLTESSEQFGRGDNPNLGEDFPPPFREARTIKKARFRDEEVGADNPKHISYKETLVHSSQATENGSGSGTLDWDFEEGDVVENHSGTMPSISFSARVHEKLSEPWKNSVVVKLLGRTIGYRTLCTRLNGLWKTAMPYSVIDLENNYFLIRFRSAGDAVDALTRGPWLIMGHYLTVQPWTPSFDFLNTALDRVTVWIRLPGLAVHLYDKKVLQKLGQLVGTVIKIDSNTASSTRGRFARIAVSITIDKPLVSQFELEGKVQKVEYEGLPVICFTCGRYGHNSNGCKESGTEKHYEDVAQPQHDGHVNEEPIQQEARREDANNVEPFGPWMIVARKGRKQFVGKEHTSNSYRYQENAGVGASRFQVLAQHPDGHVNSMPAAPTNIPSTSRHASTPFMNPTFTINNDLLNTSTARRKPPTKTVAKKHTSLKPTSSNSPSQNLFQSLAFLEREKDTTIPPHANPSYDKRPNPNICPGFQQVSPLDTTLDPTKHKVVFCSSQSLPPGDARNMDIEHRDKMKINPQLQADPPDAHTIPVVKGVEKQHIHPDGCISGVDGLEMSDDDDLMVQETLSAMMADVNSQQC